jgi:hypothetical protein
MGFNSALTRRLNGRRVKSHLPSGDIIRSSPYSPRLQDKGYQQQYAVAQLDNALRYKP